VTGYLVAEEMLESDAGRRERRSASRPRSSREIAESSARARRVVRSRSSPGALIGSPSLTVAHCRGVTSLLGRVVLRWLGTVAGYQLDQSRRERAARAGEEARLRALRAGAAGFVLKDTPPHDILAALRRVVRGEPVLSPAVTRRLIARAAGSEQDARRTRAREQLARLSERERQIAAKVGAGKSNMEISTALFLSVPTVKKHVSHVLTTLDLNNRVQIALLVHDADLGDAPGAPA